MFGFVAPCPRGHRPDLRSMDGMVEILCLLEAHGPRQYSSAGIFTIELAFLGERGTCKLHMAYVRRAQQGKRIHDPEEHCSQASRIEKRHGCNASCLHSSPERYGATCWYLLIMFKSCLPLACKRKTGNTARYYATRSAWKHDRGCHTCFTQ